MRAYDRLNPASNHFLHEQRVGCEAGGLTSVSTLQRMRESISSAALRPTTTPPTRVRQAIRQQFEHDASAEAAKPALDLETRSCADWMPKHANSASILPCQVYLT